MAQAGYTPISMYFSSTAAATPIAGNLVAGELALNTTDEKLYFKNAAGVVKLLASNAITTPVLSFQTSLSGLTPSTATTGVVTLAGTLGATSGGTSQTTYATGDILYASAANTLSKLTAGTNGHVLTLAAGVPTWAASTGGVTSFQTSLNGLTPSTSSTGAITLAGTLGETSGGTSQTTYATGDMLYASASNTLAKLAAGTNGYVLTLAAGLPTWAALTVGVTSFQTSLSGLTPSTASTGAVTLAGTLDATSGGTSQSTYAAGDILYASASNTLAKLAAGTNGHVLTLAAGFPIWAASTGGVTSVDVSGGTTGLTTSGGPITTSGTITLAGTLTVANGGTGLTAGTSGGIPYYSSTSAITSSALLTQYGVVYGGGAGAAPVATAAGTTGQVLTATTGAAPTWVTPSSGGTVTSVGQSFTGGIISVAGSPITTSGTLALTVAGTSGGIPYFSSGTTWATSAELTQYGVVYGGGAGATPVATAAGTTGQVLTATTGGAPTWAAPATSGTVTAVTGTSPVASSGGTTPAISLASGYGDTLNPYASKTANFVLGAPNGSAGVPTFRALVAADVPGSALTKTDDTNVTLTLGGSPTTALLNAASLTLGWSGQLGISRGGTNTSTAPSAYGVVYGDSGGTAYTSLTNGTTGQVLTATTGGAPTWAAPATSGTVTSVAQTFTGGIVSVAGSPITTSGTLALTVAGTSGGIPYFSSGTTWASSAALTQYGVVYGGGAGATPVSTAAGTTGQVLTATTGGAPTWAAAAGGLTGFTAALNTAAPNATNNVSSLTASGGTTNQYIAIVPKGNGGIIAAIPDSAATGGNVRGTYAVDLQTTRTSADQVASGAQSSILGGERNRAYASWSIVAGGFVNVAGGQYGGCFAGSGSSTADTGAIILGGSSSTSVGQNTTILTGTYVSDRGVRGGLFWGDSYNASSSSVGSGAQSGEYRLGLQTTDATTSSLVSSAGSAQTFNQVWLRTANTAYVFTALIVASVNGSPGQGNTKAWRLEGCIKRGSANANTALVGAVSVNIVAADAGAASWTATAIADTTNGALTIQVVGQAATTIRWSCRVITSEVGTT